MTGGPNESTRTRAGDLLAYGRRPWAEILSLLDDYSAVWGDLDGMHLAEPVPPDAPAYTHLWAWRNQVYARIRIDLTSDRHVLGVLVVAGDPPPGGEPEGRVEAEVQPVRGWGTDPRVPNLRGDLREPRLERLVTRHPAPVTFVGPAR